MRRHLTGVGAVPGQVSGPAHLVDSDLAAMNAKPGAILVVRVFHPYFAPVLPRIAGLIVQEGGLLQHAVVLAREFGVPTVVGVRNAMSTIPPGQRVSVDGASGSIEIVPEQDSDEVPDEGSAHK